MRRSIRLTLFAALSVMPLSACGTPPTTQAAPESRQVAGNLQVINRSSQDMDIFLVRGNGTRNRLGLAPASRATSFALTPAQVAGVGPVSFQAVPILRGGQAISSDQVVVTPTETITLDIPPQ
ncbi:MAG TPA: hypothetical protein VG817_12105 [Gemmatimonadales bacterium]|nr:hypothetical protein [Gemmatimonadales bacterium]